MASILLIEDDDVLSTITKELLETNGYECTIARNGIEGIAKAGDVFPDMIICDVKLPFESGYDVKKELNKDEYLSAVPFLFLSARADLKGIMEGLKLGAADYVTTPFNFGDLIATVNRAASSSERVGAKINRYND